MHPDFITIITTELIEQQGLPASNCRYVEFHWGEYLLLCFRNPERPVWEVNVLSASSWLCGFEVKRSAASIATEECTMPKLVRKKRKPVLEY